MYRSTRSATPAHECHTHETNGGTPEALLTCPKDPAILSLKLRMIEGAAIAPDVRIVDSNFKLPRPIGIEIKVVRADKIARPESSIRDRLAENLHLIESGLILISKEFHLPNSFGARGYIDLLARDAMGKLVVIELKRSDSTARQAIHELFKYTALLRSNHGVGVDRVRCVLVSTDWGELRVPFSEYLRTTKYEAEGKILLLDAEGWPSGTKPITPIENPDILEILPWHYIYLYQSAENRDTALARISDGLAEQGAPDHILVCLRHPTDERVPCPFMIYWAFSLTDSEENHSDFNPEVTFEEADVLAYRATRGVRADNVEIGYPDKFRAVLRSWSIDSVHRGGRFHSPDIWPDDAIQAILRSDRGAYSRFFQATASPKHSPTWLAFRRDIDNFFSDNEGWRQGVTVLLDDAELTPNATVSVSAFNPCDLTTAMIYAFDHKNTAAFPSLEVIVDKGGGEAPAQYVGFMMWDGNTFPCDPERTIGDILEGGLEGYYGLYHFDQLGPHEDQLLIRHGLACEIFQVDSGLIASRLRAGLQSPIWEAWDPNKPSNHSVEEFLVTNREYVASLRRLISVINS